MDATLAIRKHLLNGLLPVPVQNFRLQFNEEVITHYGLGIEQYLDPVAKRINVLINHSASCWISHVTP